MTVLGLLVASFITQGQPFLPTFSTLITAQPEKIQQRLISQRHSSTCVSEGSYTGKLFVIKYKYQKILSILQYKNDRQGSRSSIEKLQGKSNFPPIFKTASMNTKSLAFSETNLRFNSRKVWDVPQITDYNLEQRLLAQYYQGQKLPVLRYGHSGNAVRVLQTLLTYNRYGVAITGRFDVLTETAVKAFQANRRLGVDGIVGSRTWRELTKRAVFNSKRDPMEIPMFGMMPIHPWRRSFRGNFAQSMMTI